MSYVTHARASLTLRGRLKLVQLVVEEGWPQARVAERFQVARSTVAKWVARFRAEGTAGLADRSSRPHRSPNQTSQRTERRIVGLRVTRRWGPHRIAYHLGLPQSTVSKVLTRYRVPLLGHIDLNTGVRVRKPKPVRYEHERPGDLIHVDVKKLGRIPDGGGHRTLGQAKGKKNKTGVGYSFIHSAIDDHSRMVYSEILGNERQETAAGFWERADAFFASQGITVLRVLTDNGNCYRSRAFNDALGKDVTHKFHPSLSAADERENRTLPPHACVRVGIRPPLRLGCRSRGHLSGLDPQLQSPPTPYCSRSPLTHRPRP